MKTHGERILGYLGLLKGWKEDRPPTPSDLKAWQEIWTIGENELEVIQEMALRAHRQGKTAWERGDREKALEIWQEAWSLAPRDLSMLEETAGILSGRSSENQETLQAYHRRMSYLKGKNPWRGLPPGIRRVLGAGTASLIIPGGLVALLPLLQPLLNPPQSPETLPPPSGSVRPLPTRMEQNIQGVQLKEAESLLTVYPESMMLSVRGKLESAQSFYGPLDFRVLMVDSAGTVVHESTLPSDPRRGALWGEGSILPFRKDFLLPQDEKFLTVRAINAEPERLALQKPDLKSPDPDFLVPQAAAGELKPGLLLRKEGWTRGFMTWKQEIILEALNNGTKPLSALSADLIWKDAAGQPLLTRNVELQTPQLPQLKAGEKFFYSMIVEFPGEVFRFESEGFPRLEAGWAEVN